MASTGIGFKDRDQRKVTLIHMIHDPRYGVLVISDGDNTIGLTIFDSQPKPIDVNSQEIKIVRSDEFLSNTQIVDILANRNGQRVHRLSTAIDPAFRGKGIGTNVLKQLEQRLKSQGVNAISFETGVNNIPMQKTAKGYTLIEQGADGDYTNGRIIGVKLIQ